MNEDTCEKILVTGGGISFNNQIPSDSSNTGNVVDGGIIHGIFEPEFTSLR